MARLEYKTIDDLANIIFTDESHIDLLSPSASSSSENWGPDSTVKNTREQAPKKGVQLHISAWINYYEKSPQVYFYRDKADSSVSAAAIIAAEKATYEALHRSIYESSEGCLKDAMKS